MSFRIVIDTADRSSGSQKNLLADQIKINNLLCNWMLHLYSRIHFHEVEIPVFIHQKFNSSNTFVRNIFCCFYSRSSHFFTKFIRHERRRRFFDQFLISSLDRTISFRKVTSFTKLISSNLDLDMSWLFDQFFHIHSAVSKSCNSFLDCRIPMFFQIFFFPNGSHSFSTTTGSCFDHHRITNN